MSKKNEGTAVVTSTESKVTKKDRVLTAVAANPDASNADIAKILGADFTAEQVAQVKSQEASRKRKQAEAELQKPLDLDVLLDSIPAVAQLGGAGSLIEKIESIRTNSKAISDAFGSLDRAEAIAKAAQKLQGIQKV